MGKPVVSVITPVYNHERFIAQCIESVLSQTFTDWEMIIVDDGSTDRSVEIARSYGDSRIRVIQQAHRGVERLHETYNNALSLASGEFIAVLEGDDFWPKRKLEKQVPLFRDEDVVLTWGAGEFVDERGNVVYRTPSAWQLWPEAVVTNRPVGSALRALLMDKRFFYVPSSSIMLRRTALLRIGGFWQPAGVYWVDRPTWMRLALVGPFAYLDDVLGYWRWHGGQVTRTKAREVMTSSAERFWEQLSDADKQALGLTDLDPQFETLRRWTRARRALAKGERWSAARFCAMCLLHPRTTPGTRMKALLGLGLLLLPRRLLVGLLETRLVPGIRGLYLRLRPHRGSALKAEDRPTNGENASGSQFMERP